MRPACSRPHPPYRQTVGGEKCVCVCTDRMQSHTQIGREKSRRAFTSTLSVTVVQLLENTQKKGGPDESANCQILSVPFLHPHTQK